MSNIRTAYNKKFVKTRQSRRLPDGSLLCPARPILTRYLVQCIQRVDALGDNLLIACARAGDRYALVLNELRTPCRLQHPHLDIVPRSYRSCPVGAWERRPLERAVNSANCDLKLVMVIFKHVERKISVTPLEYARSAIKSTSRQNYPPEVLEFLKKCR
ncbi:unnamed protein product [Leptidea sinapis]|uniref:Uncharacterized protein n=1 Tax=Leptidea sinapis TaxID=189913 RepID=A0A5E4PZR7_9NEOP|nr:unnamed protein product [Leptidea sinapis]